jgi:hypothetical protein
MRGSTVAEMTHDVSEETIERVNVRLANFMLCGSSASLKNWGVQRSIFSFAFILISFKRWQPSKQVSGNRRVPENLRVAGT